MSHKLFQLVTSEDKIFFECKLTSQLNFFWSQTSTLGSLCLNKRGFSVSIQLQGPRDGIHTGVKNGFKKNSDNKGFLWV
jgi:hypothetical protein